MKDPDTKILFDWFWVFVTYNFSDHSKTIPYIRESVRLRSDRRSSLVKLRNFTFYPCPLRKQLLSFFVFVFDCFEPCICKISKFYQLSTV